MVLSLAPGAAVALGSADGSLSGSVEGAIAVVSKEDSQTVYLLFPGTRNVKRVRSPDGTGAAELSPDGTKLAITGIRGVWIFSRDGSGARRLPLEPSTPNRALGAVFWSPDGRELFLNDGGGLFVVSLASGRRRWLLRGERLYSGDWSPRGGRLAFVRDPDVAGDGLIQTIRPDGRGLRTIGRGGDPDFSPDGKRLAFTRGKDVYIVGLARTRPRRFARNADAPEWSPTGRSLAVTKDVECFEAGCSGRVFIIPSQGGSGTAIGPTIFDIGSLSWSRWR